MNKKLFVPEKKVIGATSPVPKAVTKAFPKIEESKNSVDPSTFGKPILKDFLNRQVGEYLLFPIT